MIHTAWPGAVTLPLCQFAFRFWCRQPELPRGRIVVSFSEVTISRGGNQESFPKCYVRSQMPVFMPFARLIFFFFFPEEWKVLTDADKDHHFLTYGENSSAFSYSS